MATNCSFRSSLRNDPDLHFLLRTGVTILRPLTATAWGTKDFYIEDPDGYLLAFGGRPTAHGAFHEPPGA